MCLRVQDDPEAKSQPVDVLVGVLRWCDGRVFVFMVVVVKKHVCVQMRIQTDVERYHCEFLAAGRLSQKRDT